MSTKLSSYQSIRTIPSSWLLLTSLLINQIRITYSNPLPITKSPEEIKTQEEMNLKRVELEFEHGFSFQNLPDECITWLTCELPQRTEYVRRKIDDLPSCPCTYPIESILDPSFALYDPARNSSFQWREASDVIENYGRDVYEVGQCVRSLAFYNDPSNLASRVCCYDESLQLITRGGAAGGYELVSPDRNSEYHQMLDFMPYVVCKMDWRAVQTQIPPNNEQNCENNPDDETFLAQIKDLEESFESPDESNEFDKR